jgi:hypothetical protein
MESTLATVTTFVANGISDFAGLSGEVQRV